MTVVMANDERKTNTKQTGVRSVYASVMAHLEYEPEGNHITCAQRWRRQGDKDVGAKQLVKVFECGLFLCDISLWSLLLPLNQPQTTETVEMPPGWLGIDRIKVKHLSVQCTWADAQAAYVSSPAILKSLRSVILNSWLG